MTSINMTMEQAVREYREYQLLKEEAEARLEELKATITAAMGEAEEVTVDVFKVRHSTVKSNRLDTSALRKALPDVAARFTRESEYRRFCVA